MRLAPSIALALSALLALPALAADVAGSGKVVSEKRAITGFQGVAAHGSIKLVLRPATAESLELRGDDNVLPLIETRVVDKNGVPMLEIGARRGQGYSSRNPVVVTVDLPVLKVIALAGSGDAVADGFKTGSLKVALAGSSDLKLRQLTAEELNLSIAGSGDFESNGRAVKATITIAGSGDVKAAALEADDVSVRIAGSGDAKVNARKALSVSIAGSGDVEYTGDATVKSSVAGSGSIKKK